MENYWQTLHTKDHFRFSSMTSLRLKGQCHVTVNKLVISRIYIVSHTWPFCSVLILVDGINPH